MPSRRIPASRTNATVLTMLMSFVATLLAAAPAQAAPVRYLDEVFSSVDVFRDIPYGQAINDRGQMQTLLLDVYSPAGDTVGDRPLVFWVHGGGFTGGNKADTAGWAQAFARRGYVAISISYRLRPGHFFEFSNQSDPEAQGAVLDATHDGQAAVRWARAHAGQLGIDPDRIAMGGNSAGAVLSLGVGVLGPDTGNSGNPGESSRICLAVPNAGAYTTQVVDELDSPAVFFHGEQDDRVPIEYAHAMESAMQAKGLFTEFHSYPGGGHVMPLSTVMPTLAPILFDRVVNDDCPHQAYAPGSGYHAAPPMRLVDTRDGTGDGGGFLGGGVERAYPISGAGSLSLGVVPAGATAVVLNVTGVFASGPTHLTVWPTGYVAPDASTLNLRPGEAVANLVTVGVGAGGRVSLRNNSGNVHVVVDLVGWYGPGPSGDRYVPVAPTRILDTRDDVGLVGAFGPAETRSLTVWLSAVPVVATAVVMNLTSVGGSADTHLTAWASGSPKPEVSAVNAPAGATVPNLAIVPLSAGGAIDLANNAGTVDVLGDVVGFFAPEAAGSGAPFTAVRPTRILDSRDGTNTPSGPLGAADIRTFDATGQGGVPPTGATAVVLNLTITQPTVATHLTVWPGGIGQPDASNLNVEAGQTRAVAVVVGLGQSGHEGEVVVRNNSGSAHVIVDVVGWIGAGPLLP